MLSGQPFDTTKVKMQTFPTMYRGFIHCFISTFRQTGLTGLYKGTTPALIANISENAVLFLSYGLCQDAVRFITRMDKGTELRSDPDISCLFGFPSQAHYGDGHTGDSDYTISHYHSYHKDTQIPSQQGGEETVFNNQVQNFISKTTRLV